MIELRNLSKNFTTADGPVDALKHVSLKINDGDIYGIIGMSGAGKSTLVRCINMLERPTEGSVLLVTYASGYAEAMTVTKAMLSGFDGNQTFLLNNSSVPTEELIKNV